MTPGFWCSEGHTPDYVIVTVGEDLDPDGIGVLVGGEGDVTNRWADGIAGVPDDVWDEANEQSEGMCTEHMTPAEWRD